MAEEFIAVESCYKFMIMNIHGLGRQIRARRQTLNVTRQALDEVCGISVHALSNLESGAANPTWAIVTRVAEALGMEARVDVRRTPANEPER